MWLNMMKRHTFGIKETLQSSNLVADHCCELFWRELHLSSPEALDVWEAGMCSGFDVVRLDELDCLLHDERIAGVEAAGYLGMG